jgi:hypothetical protein
MRVGENIQARATRQAKISARGSEIPARACISHAYGADKNF